jgi:gamma-glutamyltranspeptidase / glutathione hydrolase
MPIARLISREYAADLRKTIDQNKAAKASPATFEWPHESVVVPGAGFLLNNEMGDFNASPELTNAEGLIGTKPNLAEPRKRMLSSMTPTILARDGQLFMVSGTPGGRTIINTVLETIVGVVDFGMNAQEAIDAPRFHHQWLPDRIDFEKFGLSADTTAELERRGHTLREGGSQGVAQVIVYNAKEDVAPRRNRSARRRRRRGRRAGTSSRSYPALRAVTSRGERVVRVVGACFSSSSMNSVM